LIVAQCNHRLPSQAISDNHQLTGRPLLILIDAAFSSKLSRHTVQRPEKSLALHVETKGTECIARRDYSALLFGNFSELFATPSQLPESERAILHCPRKWVAICVGLEDLCVLRAVTPVAVWGA
jgi:hypothetical protein